MVSEENELSVVFLVGPSGAGKTTILKAILEDIPEWSPRGVLPRKGAKTQVPAWVESGDGRVVLWGQFQARVCGTSCLFIKTKENPGLPPAG